MRAYKLLAALAVCTASIAAYAQVPPLQMACWNWGGEHYWWDAPGTENPDGTFNYQGEYTDPTGMWSMSWDVDADADPFLNAVLGITNIAPTTQTYNMLVVLPIAPPITPSSLMGGSVGASTTDSNFDGQGGLSTAPNFPLYNGLIDGAGVLPLYNHPYGVTYAFAGDTQNVPNVSAGLPGPTLPGPQALNTIGIQHVFTLSPGDSAVFTSFFVVTPEPTSLLLFGLLALVRRR